MAANDLLSYIKAAREQDVSDQDIKTTLVKSGWSENEVDQAFSSNKGQSINLPTPPVPHFGMWIGFQYVMLFTSLYISALAFAGLAHYMVNQIIPDTLNKPGIFGNANEQLLRVYLAALIVAFPIFSFLFILLKKQELSKPVVKNLIGRKQLIYITLTGTFIIMIIDLIKTIYDLLNGEVTQRSFANFVVTILIAGIIFIYYLFEVREDRKQS